MFKKFYINYLLTLLSSVVYKDELPQKNITQIVIKDGLLPHNWMLPDIGFQKEVIMSLRPNRLKSVTYPAGLRGME